MRKSLAAAFFLLCAFSASAGTITSLSPNTFRLNSGEQFLTVYGTGLGNHMVFDGPAGHFELDATAVFTGSIVGWVPEAIIQKSGTYSLTVTGPNGSSGPASFTVTGFKFPLALLLPEYVRIQPRTREGAYVKYDVFAMGGSDSSPRIDCDIPSGSFFKMGTTIVTCVASNIYNETARGSFPVYVRDEEGPVITVPLDPIRVKADSIEGAKVFYDVKAYDDIYGDVRAECLPESGSIFPIGVTMVHCAALDLDLNSGHASFPIEVIGDVEPYPLTVEVPEPIFVTAFDPRGAVVDFKVSVSGTKDREPRITCNPPSGSVFAIGETVVTCDALDAWGMRGTGSFSVWVVDPNPPSILELYSKPDTLIADNRLYPIDIFVTAKDDIDLQPVCEIYSVTSKEDIDLDDGEDPKSYDWKVTGPLSLELRAERRNTSRVYNIYVACSDYFGNISRGRTSVLVTGGTASLTQESQRKRRSAR